MRNVLTATRSDLDGLVRSWPVWIATALFSVAVLLGWVPWMFSALLANEDRPLLLAIRQAQLWLPPFAIFVGWVSIRDERGSDSSDCGALTGPTERFLESFVGRAVVVVVAVSIVVCLLAALVAVRPGVVLVSSFVGGLTAVALFGLVWVAIAVGASRLLETRRRAIGLAVGLYVLFAFLWRETVVVFVSYALTGDTAVDVEQPALLASLAEPTWYLYLTRLNPYEAFDGALYYLPRLLETLVLGESATHPHAPNLFGLAVLLAWVVLPVAVVSWRAD
ncbi:ABC transporter permease subunit [Natrarchaeobius sp. A-rgal3]|uniref:ABC transporter permease subunit n=1 Tax=Natrarchaeobius versutus TaxID=1679078 RepID=UPI00350EF96F